MSDSFASRIDQLGDRAISLLYRQSVVSLLAVCTVIVLLSGSFGADPDLFARVAVGRLIEKLGYLPLQDPFAFSPKNPIWVDHEWLSGVVFFQLSQFGGDALLFSFKLALASLSVLLLLRSAHVWHPSSTPAPVWTLVCVMHGIFAWMSSIRCQVFTYLFLAVLLLAYTELWRQNRWRYLVISPFMMMAWCNLHGGFVVGLGVMGIGTAVSLLYFRRWFPFALATSVSAFAFTSLNPYGFVEYWKYILHAITMPRPAIEEWAPVAVTDVNGMPMLVFILILAIGAVRLFRTKSQRQLLVISSIFLAVGFFFAFRHIRLIPFATTIGIVFGAPFFKECGNLFEELSARYFVMTRRVVSVLLLGLGALISVKALEFVAQVPKTKLDYSAYPVSSISWLRSNTKGGRLLVDFNNGSFALWKLYPHFTISMDGRYEEVYPESTNKLVAEAFRFGTPEGSAAMEILKPTHILVPPYASMKDFWHLLGNDWKKVFVEKDYFVLSRMGENPWPNSQTIEPDAVWQAGF